MENKKGFTLLELMGVMIIISLISILTFPNIVNQIKKSKASNKKMVEDIIISQAEKYVSDNPADFHRVFLQQDRTLSFPFRQDFRRRRNKQRIYYFADGPAAPAYA